MHVTAHNYFIKNYTSSPVVRVGTLQDGDSLMDILDKYLDSGVNLTTFRFRYEGTAADTAGDSTPTNDDGRYSDEVFATVHDSLLTLYHGAQLQSHGGGSCRWAGNNLLPTLAKVSICF